MEFPGVNNLQTSDFFPPPQTVTWFIKGSCQFTLKQTCPEPTHLDGHMQLGGPFGRTRSLKSLAINFYSHREDGHMYRAGLGNQPVMETRLQLVESHQRIHSLGWIGLILYTWWAEVQWQISYKKCLSRLKRQHVEKFKQGEYRHVVWFKSTHDCKIKS